MVYRLGHRHRRARGAAYCPAEAVGAGGSFRRARSLARRNADRSGDTMNTFTSHDLKADAFPQVGVDPLDVQRVDRESALVPPMACKCGCDKACGCQCCGPRGTAAATSMTCARRSPGWRPSLPAAARPPTSAAGHRRAARTARAAPTTMPMLPPLATGDDVEPHTLPAGVPCTHVRRSSVAAHENFRRPWYVLRDSAGSVHEICRWAGP